MNFGEKLKNLRERDNLSQSKLAEIIGVDRRTIINYEAGKSFPRDMNNYRKIAKWFGVSADYLLSEKDEFTAKAYAEGGKRGKLEAEALVAEAGALFAGGSLSDEDKDAVFHALQEAYWFAKAENKKYSKRK
ncbi:MAG: helix-turn-helix domain-containing protein [Oscillospiraceae bacterium]|nr:helix-turn-helix domain-containing protein [Oscillospiraceae bacterium]